MLLQLLQRLDAVAGFDALEAVAAHQVDHHLAEAGFVIDDQADGLAFVWRECGSGHWF
jgi:hypothetical protein